MALDFLIFCQRNPKPCPLLEVVGPGQYEPIMTAHGADLRTDVPRYRVYRNGKLVSEEKEIMRYCTDELVCFLLGCSFSFETALMRAGVSLRHIIEGKIVTMYQTSIETIPADIFSGPVVVSMRPIPHNQVVRCVQVTSRFPLAHGAPLHIGNPEVIGIRDLRRPDYGEYVDVKEGEVPVFWACGVTPQAVALKARVPLMITHSPGHMFITDIRDDEIAII